MLLFNRYEYNPATDLIGKGGFSRVYKALDKKLNRNVALKIYKSSELAEKYSPLAEIQRVIDFDHPNISRYIDIEEIQKEDAFGEIEKIQVCVMEHLDGGNLAHFYQGNKNPGLFKQLLLDVLRGLAYLHQQGVIHRDIKPANLLIKNTPRGPVAKITDFGISKRSDSSFNSTSSALIVSIPYMAPEQLNTQKYGIDENISYNIDLWMLGVTVYEILSGNVLFKYNPQDTSEQIMANIMQPDIPEKVNDLPAPFRQFVQACLVKDARQRVQKAEELMDLLQQTPVTPEPIATVETNDTVTDDTQQLPAPVIAVDETEQLPASDDTVIIPAKIVAPQQPLSDDTMVIAKTPLVQAPASDDTIVISKTPLLQQPVSDDTLVLDRNAQLPSEAIVPATPPPVNKKEKPVNLFNRYDYYPISDCIGKGGFSRVYKAYDKKLSRWVALKIYKTGEFSDRYSPIAEIKRVVNLDHPNICRYLDMEEIENKNPFGENEIIQVCVMELLDGGNILEYYKQNEDHQLLIKLVRDILNGLAYLHRHGIIHRDIKPANILIKSALEGPVAKITDFGISKATDNLSSNSSSALVVSIPYMAPEQLNIKKYGLDEKIASNLDLWSLGVTIYEIVTGKVLFKNSDKDSSEQVMANIMSPQLPEKINELPEPFRKIVSLCVVKNARERVQKAEALLQVLETAVAAQSRQITVNNNSGNENKGGLFLEEVEVEKAATPKKKKATTPVPVEEPVAGSPAVRAAWLQQIPVFFKAHSMKMIVGTAVILFVSVLLLAIRYFNDRRANSTVPATAKDTAIVRQPENTPPAQNTTTITPPDKGPVQEKTMVPEPASTKKQRNTNNNREEKPGNDRKETVHANERSMVEITTATPCSLRIESPANGYNEFLPSLRNGIQIPLPPGKYYITATNLQTKAAYSNSFTVKPGKRTSFSIPGNF